MRDSKARRVPWNQVPNAPDSCAESPESATRSERAFTALLQSPTANLGVRARWLGRTLSQ